jgi:predicted CoA-binding protein
MDPACVTVPGVAHHCRAMEVSITSCFPEDVMATQPGLFETIQDFLAQKRIAIAGISHDPRSTSVALFKEFSRRSYDVVPVNPHLPEVEGRRCYARVQDIHPPVDAVLIMTAPEITETIVRDCADARVDRVWMYRAGGKGSVNNKAVAFCEERGIRIIPGQCPFMFLPGADAVHRFHGFVRKITGRYPRPSAAQPGGRG